MSGQKIIDGLKEAIEYVESGGADQSIKQRLAELERQVEELRRPQPLPYSPPPVPSRPYEWRDSNCPKCGIKLSGVMGYCCPRSGCPTGLGGSYS